MILIIFSVKQESDYKKTDYFKSDIKNNMERLQLFIDYNKDNKKLKYLFLCNVETKAKTTIISSTLEVPQHQKLIRVFETATGSVNENADDIVSEKTRVISSLIKEHSATQVVLVDSSIMAGVSLLHELRAFSVESAENFDIQKVSIHSVRADFKTNFFEEFKQKTKELGLLTELIEPKKTLLSNFRDMLSKSL